MKTGALLLATLAVAVSNTDAFGVGHGIHRTSALTQSRGSFSGSTPSHGSLSDTALQMSSNNEVIIEKDFRLSAIFLGGGLLLDQIPFLQVSIGPIVTLLGVLFLVQTFRLNFVCDDTTFSLQDTSNEDEVGENIVVGGENRWTYDSFVNYDFFPEGWIDKPQGPILVYFKETQTPSGKIFLVYKESLFLGVYLTICVWWFFEIDKWNEGPGASANSDEAMSKGAVKGQVHFFPALCNTKQLRSIWEKQNCAKL